MREGNVTIETEVRMMRARSYKPRNSSHLWKLEKARNRFFPRASKRSTALLTHFRFLTFRTVR